MWKEEHRSHWPRAVLFSGIGKSHGMCVIRHDHENLSFSVGEKFLSFNTNDWTSGSDIKELRKSDKRRLIITMKNSYHIFILCRRQNVSVCDGDGACWCVCDTITQNVCGALTSYLVCGSIFNIECKKPPYFSVKLDIWGQQRSKHENFANMIRRQDPGIFSSECQFCALEKLQMQQLKILQISPSQIPTPLREY